MYSGFCSTGISSKMMSCQMMVPLFCSPYLIIHPFYSLVPFSSSCWMKGRLHPGQVASPSGPQAILHCRMQVWPGSAWVFHIDFCYSETQAPCMMTRAADLTSADCKPTATMAQLYVQFQTTVHKPTLAYPLMSSLAFGMILLYGFVHAFCCVSSSSM